MARSKSNVTNRVRELRFHNGEMTQQDLASRIGVARQTIIAIEQLQTMRTSTSYSKKLQNA